MTTERITIDQAREAYDKTGFLPRSGLYYNAAHGCACPLGALYATRTGYKPEDPAAMPLPERKYRQWAERAGRASNWAGKSYGREYAAGFIDGFDTPADDPHRPIQGSMIPEHWRRFQEGFADGQTCRAALCPTIRTR